MWTKDNSPSAKALFTIASDQSSTKEEYGEKRDFSTKKLNKHTKIMINFGE